MYGSQWGSLQLHAVYKKPYLLLQVTQESVSVLQVTWESISGTASHARIRIRYCKSHVLHLNVQWNWRFVWWNHYHHSTKLYRKKYHSFVAIGIVCALVTIQTAQLVIFSGITSYYGDNYILLKMWINKCLGDINTFTAVVNDSKSTTITRTKKQCLLSSLTLFASSKSASMILLMM